MKKLCTAGFLIMLAAACSTPGPITGRPDSNVGTSGTLGSVKATDEPPPERRPVRLPKDSTDRRRDTTQH